ncbi:MAG: YccT family protein [Vibrionaceae bacterium]
MRDPIKLALFLALVSTQAFAQVQLTVPDNVQVMVINEEHSQYSKLGLKNQTQFILPDGESQILFRVTQVVREDGSTKSKFKSGPMLLSFVAKEQDIALQLPRFQTMDEAKAFAKAPSISLVSRGKKLDFRSDSLDTGFNLTPDYVREVQDYNRKQGLASVNFGFVTDSRYDKPNVAKLPQSANLQPVKSAQAATNLPAQNAESMLQFWFAQADSQQQKRFMAWAVQNIK